MAIIDLLIDILSQIGKFIMNLLSWIYENFMDLSFFEKMITISFVPAFFAVILSVAKFHLFNTYYYINNPLAVYMIGIVFVMIATHFFPGTVSLAIRIISNAYYLFWVIYIHIGKGIAQTDYSLSPGYFVNLGVPILLIALSVFSYLEGGD